MRINTRVTTSQLSLRIVRALAAAGTLRFNELDRAANARSAPVLSKQLKRLRRDGIVERHVIKLGPPAITEYSLTPLGIDLSKASNAFMSWLDAHGPEIAANREHSAA